MNQYLPSTQKIAFIQAGWNTNIVAQGRKSFVADMKKSGISSNEIEIFDVSGSLEIPLQAQYLAKTGHYAIIVACGLITNGGIYHHEFVASTVIDGIMRVQLDTGVPILSVVLSPQNFHESEEHQEFFYNHFTIKGQEAAVACLKTLENMSAFTSLKQAA